MQLVLVGSKAEAGLNRKLKEAVKAPIIDLTGKTSVKTLAACLERCALFIGNDSGVAHLASAVGTQSLTIFGPSNAAAWSPIGSVRWQPGDKPPAVEEYQEASTWSWAFPVSPAYIAATRSAAGWGCPSRQCLTMIKPSEVARSGPAHATPGQAGTLAKRERQGDHKQDDNGGGDRDELYVANDV